MTVRPTLTHAGVHTRDLEAMASFYKDVLGLVETDRGTGITVPRALIFLSSDPLHHHQFVLSDGRGPDGPSTVNQISFLVRSLDDIREIRERARNRGVPKIRGVNHGNAWSLYFYFPEENPIEIYAESPWYVPQPHANPLDLDKTNDDILKETEENCRQDPGMIPVETWRSNMRDRLTREV